jgi:hypothetical protein
MTRMHAATTAARLATWVRALTTARAHDALLTMQGYCEHDCPVRTVDIRVKDYDDQLLTLAQTRGLRCPLCGAPLKCHVVRTSAEQRAVDDRDARANVNRQLYERDHGPGIPLHAFGDDRLPGDPPKVT